MTLASPPATTRAVLELRLAEVNQLFNSMDPAPFRERDLDPEAEAYIVEWARETRPGEPLGLTITLTREPPAPATTTMIGDAIGEYFRRRATSTERRLRQLFRTGRRSLAIGLAFVAAAIFIGERVMDLLGAHETGRMVKESVIIGAWVALWRPLEIFLYDWWPIRADVTLYERLGNMTVRLTGANTLPT